MDVPDSSHYKALYAGMIEIVQKITMKWIEEYLHLFDKKLMTKTKTKISTNKGRKNIFLKKKNNIFN